MGRPSKLLNEAECVATAERLSVLLDAQGWDAEDVARKLGVGIARAKFLLQGECPEPAEFARMVALLERHGA